MLNPAHISFFNLLLKCLDENVTMVGGETFITNKSEIVGRGKERKEERCHIAQMSTFLYKKKSGLG